MHLPLQRRTNHMPLSSAATAFALLSHSRHFSFLTTDRRQTCNHTYTLITYIQHFIYMQHSYIRSVRKRRRLRKTSAPAHFLQLDRWRCTLLEASITGCPPACFFFFHLGYSYRLIIAKITPMMANIIEKIQKRIVTL